MKNNQGNAVSNKIRLSPAIGDWTTLQFRDSELEKINVSKINNINFNNVGQKELKYLLFMHYRLAEMITQKLSADLDIKVELHTIEVWQLTYEDFLANQKDRFIQMDLPVSDLGKVNLLLEWKLAEMLINRICGGSGESNPGDSFSQIESNILKMQIQEILPLLGNIWKNIFIIEQNSTELFLNKYVQDKKISARDTCVFFYFYFYFGENNLVRISLVYPSKMLKQLLKVKQKQPDPIKKRIFFNQKILEKIKIPVRALLGKTTITMKDLKNIQAGDVVSLDNKITEPIQVRFSKKIKFLAQPGIVKNHLGIQLIFPDETMEQLAQVTKVPRETKSSPSSPVETPPLPVVPPPPPIPEVVFQENITKNEPVTIEQEEVELQEAIENNEEILPEYSEDDSVENDETEENDTNETDEDLDEDTDAEEIDDDAEYNDDEEESEEDYDDEEEEDEEFEEPVDEPAAAEKKEKKEKKEGAGDDDFSWDDIEDLGS
jgi:flagellar motor switch protein FliM